MWMETAIATMGAFLFLLTLVWHDWIEALFRVDPDHGNGALEVVIPAGLFVLTIVLGLLARRDWRVRQDGAASTVRNEERGLREVRP